VGEPEGVASPDEEAEAVPDALEAAEAEAAPDRVGQEDPVPEGDAAGERDVAADAVGLEVTAGVRDAATEVVGLGVSLQVALGDEGALAVGRAENELAGVTDAEGEPLGEDERSADREVNGDCVAEGLDVPVTEAASG